MLVKHIWVKLSQLVQQHLIFFLYIVGISRNHKQQQRVAFNMAQEAQTQAFAFAGALDNARDVGHHKRLVVAIAHNAQRGFKGGKGVIGNLRTRTRQR